MSRNERVVSHLTIRVPERAQQTIGARRQIKLRRAPHPDRGTHHRQLCRLVGRLRDEELAARTGHTVDAVHQKRLALGLPLPNSKIYRWNLEHDKLLGTRPDGEVAA